MRNILWKITVLITAFFLFKDVAFAQGLNGFLDLNKNTTRQYEDGDRTSSSEFFNRTLYLNVHEPITPVLSYQLNLRTNFLDSKTTDSMNETSTKFSRSLEPGLDLTLGLSPDTLPSLTVQLDKQRNYDYLSPRKTDDNTSVYSINSAYDLPPGDVKLRYTFNYAYTITNTPLSLTNKTIGDNFNGTYNIGYAGHIWQDKADYSLNYQGNYTRNKIEQFVTETGTVLNERIPLAGLYVFDDVPVDPTTGALNNESNLINNDFNTPISGINIGPVIPAASHTNHNIGIWVSPGNSIDRLYIYVDKDVSRDTNLANINNWKVYSGNSNTAVSTWTEIRLSQVTIFTDTSNNIFRYEIKFSTEQNASYFKAVNLATVNASGLSDVFVTEIEALGTDPATEEKLVTTSDSFSQQLSLNTNFRPTGKLTLSLNYSIERSDQNIISLEDSVGGVFENIFSDSFGEGEDDFISNITRSYSASVVWLTHRFLTTSLRAQRNESFDNIEESDVETNSYNLSFLSDPLPTLNANLSLIRSDSYSFSEKVSTNDSLLLSVGSRLYRDLNMITDIIYTRSNSYVTETESSTRQINGTLDALLTRKVSGTVTYHFSRTVSDGTTSNSREGSLFITYRPGKLVNVTGNFRMADTDGETSTSEGVLLDWLPLPAVRLNANYQHSDSEPGPVKADTINSYVIWYVTKFADLRLTNSYSKQVDEKESENYGMSASLNCRF
ncbi:MAG: hypothetical protein HZC49_08730 [Nitrospirae bacterium]|nr:hypothetical protein [Nitrospirota bacterium]